MRSTEYFLPFEGNFFAEGSRLLGGQVSIYSRLQAVLDYPTGVSREEHLRNIQLFYEISVKTGIKDLINRVDPLTPWIAKQINSVIEGRRIIDVGCCNGFFTVFYALSRPQAQFMGIDISEVALERARKVAEEHGAQNVRWVQGDILDPRVMESLDNPDTIILQDVLYQIFGSRDPQKERKILGLLAPQQNKDGIVVISQEGKVIENLIQERDVDGYTCEKYEQETEFDKNCGSYVTCEIAVFRKRL